MYIDLEISFVAMRKTLLIIVTFTSIFLAMVTIQEGELERKASEQTNGKLIIQAQP
jgi:hypothetical protein